MWETLRETEGLGDAIIQLHHAARLVASVPYTFQRQTALALHPTGCFATAWLEGQIPYRLGLLIGDLMIAVIDEEERIVSKFVFHGKTCDEVHSWLEHAVSCLVGDIVEIALMPAAVHDREEPFNAKRSNTVSRMDVCSSKMPSLTLKVSLFGGSKGECASTESRPSSLGRKRSHMRS